MNRFLCKIVSALVGAIIAGAIAIASMTLLSDFQGIDLIGVIVGIAIGALVAFFLYEKVCAKT